MDRKRKIAPEYKHARSNVCDCVSVREVRLWPLSRADDTCYDVLVRLLTVRLPRSSLIKLLNRL
jgi:hypothetical protein